MSPPQITRPAPEYPKTRFHPLIVLKSLTYKHLFRGESRFFTCFRPTFLPATYSLITASNPGTGSSIRMSQVEEYEFILDLSDACQGDRRAVLRLIAGMPDTLEQLQVLQTVSSI